MGAPKLNQKSEFNLEDYLNESNSTERLRILKSIKRGSRPLSPELVSDLAIIDLPISERVQLIRHCCQENMELYESVLTEGATDWDPNLSSVAIREWVKHSDLVQYKNFEKTLKAKPSQRVYFTLLENAFVTGGHSLISKCTTDMDLSQNSDATLSMLFLRASQWCIISKDLIHFAEKTVVNSIYSNSPSTHVISHALEYLAGVSESSLDNLVVNPIRAKMWDDIISSFRFAIQSVKSAEKNLQNTLKKNDLDDNDFYLELFGNWPPSFCRNKLKVETIVNVVKTCAKRPSPSEIKPPPTYNIDFEFFGGIKEQKLTKVFKELNSNESIWFLEKISGFLGEKSRKEVASLVSLDTKASERIRSDFGKSQNKAKYSLDPSSRSVFLKSIHDISKSANETNTTDDVWATLHEGHKNPKKAKLNEVKKAAKSVKPIFAPAIFRLVENFKGQDEMIPLVLDKIHSADHSTLFLIAKSLVGIETRMSLSHFIKILGNEEIPSMIRLELCGLVNDEKMKLFQNELRDMVNSIRQSSLKIKAIDIELIEAFRELMSSIPEKIKAVDSNRKNQESKSDSIDEKEVDQQLLKRFPNFENLHPEIKRSFRTAQIIQTTIHDVAKDGKVDISPVVDLQFKGLEIYFRKTFEGMIYNLVQDSQKILQRKLDKLGYLRPSQDAMNAFENYIASLPVVRDIPQFSRYKLNRILRAVANFRPGRRFTVEGIKGYAFIFLAFGRKECRYGLENTLEINSKNDEELAALCRDLHVYQDIRNQAVHEGLPPHMIGNIDGYWNLTASILKRIEKLK